MRPVHHLLERIRQARARKRARIAAADLSRQAQRYQQQSRQTLIDKLCGELGRPPLKLQDPLKRPPRSLASSRGSRTSAALVLNPENAEVPAEVVRLELAR